MISGFVYGEVIDDEDPQGVGCVRVKVPVLFEDGTPYWCRPAGWPGSGALGQGSQYPTPVGAQVVLIFEFGDPDAGAIFLPTLYGRKEDGSAGGPTAITEVDGAANRNKRVVVWDDDIFTIYITLEGDADGRKLVLIDKESGGNITFDARDGSDGKSRSIAIEAQTAVYITAKGKIQLDAGQVIINGKPVTGRGMGGL